MNILHSIKRGFTIIELMVAVSLFAVVSTAALAGVLNAQNLAKRAQGAQAVFDNLNFAVENMSRLVKVGRNYHCDRTALPVTTPRDCAGTPADSFVFAGSDGKFYMYARQTDSSGAGFIVRADCPGTVASPCSPNISNGLPITTTTEVDVKKMSFYVSGSGFGDTVSTWILLLIGGTASTTGGPIDFNLQTTLTQRHLEN